MRSPDELRKELLADPNTQAIAKNLGVDLAEYVEEVIYFATHTDEEPELRYIDDADWKQQGVTTTSQEDIDAWFERVGMGEVVLEASKVRTLGDAFGISAEEKKKKAINQMLGGARRS